MENKKFAINNLNTIYRFLKKEKIKEIINDIFEEFKKRIGKIEKKIKDNDIFLASLGILNSFDHYANFYKGIVPNEKDNNEQVKCTNKKCNCDICCCTISYKCRAGGSRTMQLNKWHYSNNLKWEMTTVGEGYKNFLKNTAVSDNKKRKAICNLRNQIDHNGFFSGNEIKIQNDKLLFEDIDLFELLKTTLDSFEKEIKKELDKEDFRVVKSSRVIRFLDHLFYIKPYQFKNTNNKR